MLAHVGHTVVGGAGVNLTMDADYADEINASFLPFSLLLASFRVSSEASFGVSSKI